MVRRTKTFFEFAEFRLFPDDRLLLSNGQPVKVSTKAFDILVILVENAGDLVTKDDLMQAVWPDSFVEEANIQVQVSVLRKALNVSGRKVFETVPRKGYRFTAPVTMHEFDSEAGVNGFNSVTPDRETNGHDYRSESEPVDLNIKRLRLILAAGVVLVFLSVIGWALGAFSHREVKADLKSFGDLHLLKLTDTGKAHDPAMSTDGRWIAYVNDEDTGSTVILRNRESGVERQLLPASAFSFENLTFSPDGASVYYTHQAGDEYQPDLFKQSIDGGPPVYVLGNITSKITFAPQGRTFAFLRPKPGNSGLQLITADVNGSNEQLILDPSRNIFAPAWSPDGKRIAFFRFDDETDEIGNRFRLCEIDLSERRQKPISQKFWGYLGEICWINGGKGLLVIAGDTPAPVSQIWHIDSLTGNSTKVTNDLNDYNGLEVDPATGQILTSYAEGFSGIWITGKHRNFSEAQQITFGAGQEDGGLGVAWAKNGRIVFSGRKSGYWTLWVMNPDGSDRAQLTPEVAQDGDPVLSSDSRTIFFNSDRADGLKSLWKVNSDGGGMEKLPGGKEDPSSGQQESWPEISPDGNYLFYSHTDAERNRQLRKRPILGGGAVQLSNLQMISNPAVSPDGTLVAFLFADRGSDPVKTGMVFLPIAGGDPIRIVTVPAATPWYTPIRWQPDGSALTYVACDRSACNLWNLPLSGGPAYQITKFDKNDIPAFSWSPDGDRIAISRAFTRNNLVLISGFRIQ